MNKDAYLDMYDMPHHVSKKHPRMPLINRAAQFAPFAALTGFEECIDEEARLTDLRREDSCEQKALADRNLMYLQQHAKEHPKLCVKYFVRDIYKAGGSYEEKVGHFKRLDLYERKIYFMDGIGILIDDIVSLSSEGFRDDFADE